MPTSADAYAALREFYKDEVMRMLHEIPVESLSRNKGGIRVALLRDSGYKSMKQIYELDYYELLAINGIGPQNAKRILAESSRIAKEVRATIAAKPNFTQNATGKKLFRSIAGINGQLKYTLLLKIFLRQKRSSLMSIVPW